MSLESLIQSVTLPDSLKGKVTPQEWEAASTSVREALLIDHAPAVAGELLPPPNQGAMVKVESQVPARIAPRRDYEALAIKETVPDEFASSFTESEWKGFTPALRVEAMQWMDERAVESTEDIQADFPKVVFPTSGSKYFTMPDGTDVKSFEASMVIKTPARGIWLTATATELMAERFSKFLRGRQPNQSWAATGQISPDDMLAEPMKGVRPTCRSLDGVKPDKETSISIQAETCGDCPWNKWDTGRKLRGKGCKQRMNNFLTFDAEDVPTLFSVPPTSLKIYGNYTVALRQTKVPGGIFGVRTVFGLEPKTNPHGPDYMILTLAPGRKLRFAEMKSQEAIRTKFETLMRQRGIQVEEATADDAVETPSSNDIPF